MMENALVVLHAQFLGSSPAPCGQKHSAVQGCRSEWLLFSLAVWVLQYRQLVVQVLGWARHSELCICTDPQHCKWGLRGRSSGFCVSFWCILRFCCPFLLQFYCSMTSLLFCLPPWKTVVLRLQIWVWEGCMGGCMHCNAAHHPQLRLRFLTVIIWIFYIFMK